MPRAKMDVSELLRLAKTAGVAADELKNVFTRAITKASIAGLAAWRQAMPVFTGEGVNSILSKGVAVQTTGGGMVYTDTLFATTPQVIVVDEGRTPGATPPPLGPIKRWVELKVGRGGFDVDWAKKSGGALDDAIHYAAIKIQQAIGKRGLPARRLSHKATAIAQKILEAEIEEAAADFRRRIGT